MDRISIPYRPAVRFAAFALAGVLAIVPTADLAATRGVSGFVVFGTSLSDPGNAFALAGGTNTPPDYSVDPLLVPDRPYTRGGHHFSNGATWVEQLAAPLGLGGTTAAAFRSSSGVAANFAVAAARARDDGVNVTLDAQVGAFLARVNGAAPSDAIYAMEMGGNDVRDAFVAFPSGGSAAILQAALTAIADNIMLLHARGARTFLVWNAPNIALTPAVRALDAVNPGAMQLAAFLAGSFNAQLDVVLDGLSALPDIQIARFDVFQTVLDIVTAPTTFGMTNVTQACIEPGDPPFVCDAPDEFLFWDGIHPTRATHAIVATRVAELLGLN